MTIQRLPQAIKDVVFKVSPRCPDGRLTPRNPRRRGGARISMMGIQNFSGHNFFDSLNLLFRENR
jgi:hypothetical protein